MPQVYSVDESNQLWRELKELVNHNRAEVGVDIADIKAQIDDKFNELFTLLHENKNRIDLLDQTARTRVRNR